MKLNN